MMTTKITNESIAIDTPEIIANDLLSGNSHFRAWCAVLNALNEVDQCIAHRDESKCAVENVCDWIRSHGVRK